MRHTCTTISFTTSNRQRPPGFVTSIAQADIARVLQCVGSAGVSRRVVAQVDQGVSDFLGGILSMNGPLHTHAKPS